MTKNDPPDSNTGEAERHEPDGNVVPFPSAVLSYRRSTNDGDDEALAGRASSEQNATTRAEPAGSESDVERDLGSRTTIGPLPSSVPEGIDGNSVIPEAEVSIRIFSSFPGSCSREHGDLVRHHTNAAVRPILKAYARRKGLLSRSLEAAIDGPTALTHPAVARELGGALLSEAVRNAIAENADHALVPLNVRAGLAKMIGQNLIDPPPLDARKAFPDWNKPMVPFGQHHRVWHAEDAAQWLRSFPPNGRILHPLNTWDNVTAARWLNDRSSVSADGNDSGRDEVVVAIDASRPMKPALQVLHDLDDLELEEITYRVFVEQLRRDVMPVLVSRRRIHVRNALLHVTIGYRTLDEARRSVHEHDLMWIESIDRLFEANSEWIYDLCRRILETYTWPTGFSELELQATYPKPSVC